MQQEIFDRLWTAVFSPKIQQLTSACPRLAVGKDKSLIWFEYERMNKVIHAYVSKPDGRIDRHKVGAAMTGAILHVQPLILLAPYDDRDRSIKNTGRFANELPAFHVALSIVQSFILTKAKLSNDATTAEVFKNGFVFPPAQHESYDMHTCKALHYAKIKRLVRPFYFCQFAFYDRVLHAPSRKKPSVVVSLSL